MDKIFSARTCSMAELVEITNLRDLGEHKRVYICSNPLCTQSSRCSTICEKTLEGLQYPLDVRCIFPANE